MKTSKKAKDAYKLCVDEMEKVFEANKDSSNTYSELAGIESNTDRLWSATLESMGQANKSDMFLIMAKNCECLAELLSAMYGREAVLKIMRNE